MHSPDDGTVRLRLRLAGSCSPPVRFKAHAHGPWDEFLVGVTGRLGLDEDAPMTILDSDGCEVRAVADLDDGEELQVWLGGDNGGDDSATSPPAVLAAPRRQLVEGTRAKRAAQKLAASHAHLAMSKPASPPLSPEAPANSSYAMQRAATASPGAGRDSRRDMWYSSISPNQLSPAALRVAASGIAAAAAEAVGATEGRASEEEAAREWASQCISFGPSHGGTAASTAGVRPPDRRAATASSSPTRSRSPGGVGRAPTQGEAYMREYLSIGLSDSGLGGSGRLGSSGDGLGCSVKRGGQGLRAWDASTRQGVIRPSSLRRPFQSPREAPYSPTPGLGDGGRTNAQAQDIAQGRASSQPEAGADGRRWPPSKHERSQPPPSRSPSPPTAHQSGPFRPAYSSYSSADRLVAASLSASYSAGSLSASSPVACQDVGEARGGDGDDGSSPPRLKLGAPLGQHPPFGIDTTPGGRLIGEAFPTPTRGKHGVTSSTRSSIESQLSRRASELAREWSATPPTPMSSSVIRGGIAHDFMEVLGELEQIKLSRQKKQLLH